MKHSTLFLDESGKSSLAEKQNEPFLLSGVILDDDEINSVGGFFNYIKRKYKIDPAKPFHSYDIFEDKRSKLSTLKAKFLATTLADFISIIPIKIQIISIDKSMFKKTLGVRSLNDFKGSAERKLMKEFPYKIMSSLMFTWFANYLRRTNGIGQIVVDSRSGGDFELLKSLDNCKDPLGPLTKRNSKLIKEKCNAICFAEKHFLSGGIEITDLISYTSFFHARSAMTTVSNIKLELVWQRIKKLLRNKEIYKISDQEIKNFFKIDQNGVHKYLKT